MRFSVKVPVLSVNTTVTAPSVSTADSRSTSALRWASRHMPRASARVATIGSPSGTAATASAMPVLIINNGSRPATRPSSVITTITPRAAHSSCSDRRRKRFSSGEASPWDRATSSELWPSSVRIPVATTTPTADPRVTAVPLNAMPVRSDRAAAAATGAVDLATGTDSPVRVDSSHCSALASTSRTSAVTTSPPLISTTSPGTSASAATDRTVPPRRTRVVIEPSRRSASIERTARRSAPNPMAPLSRITTAMAIPSTTSLKANDITAAAASSRVSTLLNWLNRIDHTLRGRASRSRLGPAILRRWAASMAFSPRSASTPSLASASATGSRWASGSASRSAG